MDELIKIVQESKKNNKTFSFTNGCFDIVHLGHIDYLKKSKSICDKLIVAINSDLSVSRLKGSSRPINSQKSRADFLASLNFVDYVIIFDEETPLNIIKKIKPNVLTKGADYKINQVVGREYAENVILLDFLPGYSTSKIIKKIKNA